MPAGRPTHHQGGGVAILRSRDNGVYDPVPVVFENLFSEQRGFMARTFMVASRITARTFLKDRHLALLTCSWPALSGMRSMIAHGILPDFLQCQISISGNLIQGMVPDFFTRTIEVAY